MDGRLIDVCIVSQTNKNYISDSTLSQNLEDGPECAEINFCLGWVAILVFVPKWQLSALPFGRANPPTFRCSSSLAPTSGNKPNVSYSGWKPLKTTSNCSLGTRFSASPTVGSNAAPTKSFL